MSVPLHGKTHTNPAPTDVFDDITKFIWFSPLIHKNTFICFALKAQPNARFLTHEIREIDITYG